VDRLLRRRCVMNRQRSGGGAAVFLNALRTTRSTLYCPRLIGFSEDDAYVSPEAQNSLGFSRAGLLESQ
jgi:hypothetical protein